MFTVATFVPKAKEEKRNSPAPGEHSKYTIQTTKM